MTDDSFENQLPDDLQPIADALREGRSVADGHLLDRVLRRIRPTSRPRPRLWLSIPRLAVIASLGIAVLIGGKLTHVNVVRGVATLAGSLGTSSSTSPTGSAADDVYCHHASGCTPLTPGFWKNHQADTSALLPVKLGGYSVGSFTQAQAVFKTMNCSISSSQGAIGCLAGQLLAAKLNVNNGLTAPSCVTTAITNADALLVSKSYAGPSGTYSLTSTQRAQAVALAGTLDKFNNTGNC